MKQYRSAKGRLIDWNAMAQAPVSAEQRELVRKPAPPVKSTTRMRGGHVPTVAEEVEEVVEAVEETPKPGKRKKNDAPVEEEVVTPPAE